MPSYYSKLLKFMSSLHILSSSSTIMVHCSRFTSVSSKVSLPIPPGIRGGIGGARWFVTTNKRSVASTNNQFYNNHVIRTNKDEKRKKNNYHTHTTTRTINHQFMRYSSSFLAKNLRGGESRTYYCYYFRCCYDSCH